MNDILILTGVNKGQKAQLTHLSKGLRQIAIASIARIVTIDITRPEKDRFLLPTRCNGILAVLDLLDDSNESE